MIEREVDPIEATTRATREQVLDMAMRIIQRYRSRFKGLSDSSLKRILYYVGRDYHGYGPLEPVMQDYRVEDISCDGVGLPIFVWHRNFESIPTNIAFHDREELDSYIIKLAHRAAKHVSSAFPIVDAMLPGKHRLAATFMEEVSPRGSTFSIRKFRQEPFSIVELVESKTLSASLAAYFWLLLENKATVLIVGPTGSGKTTLLNALALLVKPGLKLITVEETPELNLPHKNWVQFVSRAGYGLTGNRVGEVSLYELVRVSLRYRPDYLIVGEVRGEEAYVLFQALATGHGGLSTMHGEDLEGCIRRLTSPPMNIPASHIPLVNAVVLIDRVPLPKRGEAPTYGRRIRSLWEVAGHDTFIQVAEWEPSTDTYATSFHKSFMLEYLARKLGRARSELLRELERRSAIISWMAETGVRRTSEVASIIYQYYHEPQRVYEAVIQAPTLAIPEVARMETPALHDELADRVISLLTILRDAGGSITFEDLMARAEADAVTLWRYISLLKQRGHVELMEGFEGGFLKTRIRLTEKGATFIAGTRPA
jgi:flagellar protein FlaI